MTNTDSINDAFSELLEGYFKSAQLRNFRFFSDRSLALVKFYHRMFDGCVHCALAVGLPPLAQGGVGASTLIIHREARFALDIDVSGVKTFGQFTRLLDASIDADMVEEKLLGELWDDVHGHASLHLNVSRSTKSLNNMAKCNEEARQSVLRAKIAVRDAVRESGELLADLRFTEASRLTNGVLADTDRAFADIIGSYSLLAPA